MANAHTRVLAFKTEPSVVRESLTRTGGSNYGTAAQVFSWTQRPDYHFLLRVGPMDKSEVECLSAMHAYHQGARSFFWDGGEWGRVDDYNLVGEGDSTKRIFYLPNRFIGASSFQLRTLRPSTGATSAWASGYALEATAGRVTFNNSTNTIPRSGDDVQARYAFNYHLRFAPDGLVIEEIARGIYLAELDLIENTLIDPLFNLEVFSAAAFYQRSIDAVIHTTAVFSPRFTPAGIDAGAGLLATAMLSTQVTRALFGQTAITSGAISASVAHYAGSVAAFTLVPGWNTTWWVTSKGLNAAEVSFSTQVGSGGNFVYWEAVF